MRDYDDVLDLLDAEREDVVRFLAVFSRFEFALKRGGFASGGPQRVDPNWDQFAAAIAQHFDFAAPADVAAAVTYIEQNPPHKEVLVNNAVAWAANVRPPGESRMQSLLIHVRVIRNNLFHGGKYPEAPPLDPDRDTVLLQHGLMILDACLSVCENHFQAVFARFMNVQP